MKHLLLRINRSVFFISFVFIFCCKIQAQDSAVHINNAIQQQLENIAESRENEENDYTDFLETYNHYAKHPLNINKASFEELQQLKILNDIQINNLLKHIQLNGYLLSIYELQTIEGITTTHIQKLLPYIRVSESDSNEKISTNDLFLNGQHKLIVRYGRVLEQQKGFTAIDSAALAKSPNSRYTGSADKMYLRYNYTLNNRLSYGFTAEKDQGELFLKKNLHYNYNSYTNKFNNNLHNGFDFYSAHVCLQNTGIIKSAIVGDYIATFGQGLTLWNGYAINKSYNIISGKRSPNGIKPYKSVDENNFFRGTATTLSYKNFSYTAFVSYKKVDGNITDTTSEGKPKAISSLQQTGIHSTPAEIADKHAVAQTIIGSNISYKKRQLQIGITAVNYQLDKDFNRIKSTYNQFEFSSKHNYNIGVDYNYIFKNFNFFGEQTVSKSGGLAFVNGALIFLDPKLYVTIIHRNYQRNYQNMLSNAFGQNNINQNEKGYYAGLCLMPTSKITFNTYFDSFVFPWLKFNVNNPSKGYEFLIQLDVVPSKKIAAYARYRKLNTPQNSNSSISLINYTTNNTINNYRVHISYTLLPWIKLKNRIEYVNYQSMELASSNGFMMYQDINLHKPKSPLSLTFRYAIFQTDNYNTRIYAYENDVEGFYSIPSYAYRGTRFYTLINYNFNKCISVDIKYSQTFYDDRTFINEGSLNEIEGNKKSEIRAQVVCKF